MFCWVFPRQIRKISSVCRLLNLPNALHADQTEQSDQGPHNLPVCKNRFAKFARIFSRRHKQTTFSDAIFLGILKVYETICMKCQSLYPWTNKKNNINLSSAELAQRVVKV